MKIIDTFSEIENCFIDGKFSISRWETYAQNIFPNLQEKLFSDSKDYDFDKDIVPVVEMIMKKHDEFVMAHDSFCAVTNGLSEKIREKLGKTLEDVLVIFYLGLCNGAGWATNLDGKPVVLIGAEKIVELSWYNRENMIALIYHELGHIWHFRVRKIHAKPITMKDKSLWQLYTEGIAMYIEQLLCGDDSFYHQNRDGWLSWCKDNKLELYKEFIRRIDCDESTQAFFGDWCNYKGRTDVGYYLGCELVKDLAKGKSLQELADVDMKDFEGKLRELYS